MKSLSLPSFLLVLSAAFLLLLVGVSRGEAPTIVSEVEYDDLSLDDDLFGPDDDGGGVGSGGSASGGVPPPVIRTDSARTYLEDCREAGFDPMQLACTTCSILPPSESDNDNDARGTCEICCQSYRSLEKRTRRYERAILIHTGYPESVNELVRDDVDGILDRKGSDRFRVRDMTPDMQMMARMGMFQQQPSVILWFSSASPAGADDDEEDSDPNALAAQADEITVLTDRGLGRDDARDMLLTLLPDE